MKAKVEANFFEKELKNYASNQKSAKKSKGKSNKTKGSSKNASSKSANRNEMADASA